MIIIFKYIFLFNLLCWFVVFFTAITSTIKFWMFKFDVVNFSHIYLSICFSLDYTIQLYYNDMEGHLNSLHKENDGHIQPNILVSCISVILCHYFLHFLIWCIIQNNSNQTSNVVEMWQHQLKTVQILDRLTINGATAAYTIGDLVDITSACCSIRRKQFMCISWIVLQLPTAMYKQNNLFQICLWLFCQLLWYTA